MLNPVGHCFILVRCRLTLATTTVTDFHRAEEWTREEGSTRGIRQARGYHLIGSEVGRVQCTYLLKHCSFCKNTNVPLGQYMYEMILLSPCHVHTVFRI